MALLPSFPQFTPQSFTQMVTQWKSILDNVISNPILQGNLVAATVINGSNVINHGLGRMPRGWFLVDSNVNSVIYKSAPLNSTTITLTSGAAGQISLWVF